MSEAMAYKADIKCMFFYNDTVPYKIPSELISYILIDYEYETQVLPMIQMKIKLDNDMYTKVTESFKKSKFYLEINKTNVMTNTGLTKKVLSGKFGYISSNNTVNFTKDLNLSAANDNNGVDTSFRSLNLGLVSSDQTDNLRQSYNGVYENVDTETLLGMAMEGLPNYTVEKPKYNTTYDQIIVPPVTSRYKFIEHVFSQDAFFNTNFQFFTDFDRTYLTSKNGNAVNAGDAQPGNVIITVEGATGTAGYEDGNSIDGGTFHIHVNGSDTNMIINQATEKVATEVVAYDDNSGGTQNLSLKINNTKGSDMDKKMVVRSSDAALIKNDTESNSVFVAIMKQNVDPGIFTPNKSIKLQNYKGYEEYNGSYLLSYKKEFYKLTKGEFVITCDIGLKRIANLEASLQSTDSNPKSSLAVSGTKTSTKTQKSHLKSVVAKL